MRVVNPWSWYPIVASQSLAAGSVMTGTLHGEKLVAWRSRDGHAGVWNDRCPHRSMSLSLGATAGETLVCPYHGWQFESDGACSRIPAHPDLTPSRAARAKIYPAIEADGYLWACLGEPATAQPDHPLLAGITPQPLRSLHVNTDAETLALILLLNPLSGPATHAIWRQEGGSLAVTHADAETRFAFPALVVHQPANGAGYAAFIQPTGEASAAIHLALLDDAPLAARLAMNSALVRLRRDLPNMLRHPDLDALREACAGLPES